MIDPSIFRPRRRWRWVKRVAFAVLLSTTLFAVEQAVEWKLTRRAGQKKLDAITAHLDATDPGWRFDDVLAAHNAAVPPDEANSALRASDLVRAVPAPASKAAQGAREEFDRARLPNETPATEEWNVLDAQCAAWNPAAAGLRAWTADTPTGAFRIDYRGGDPTGIRLDKLQDLRGAGQALSWDALRAANDGRPDPALASAAAGLHLVRSVRFEPMLIASLVRIAMATSALQSAEQALAWCANAGDEPLAAVQALALTDANEFTLRHAMRGDRAMTHRILEMMDWGDDIQFGVTKTTEEALGWVAFRQYMPANVATGLGIYDEWLAILELPPALKAGAVRDWKAPEKTQETSIARLLIPAANKVADAELRYRAKCLCTAAGIACERYRLKHGRWPAALGDLAAFGIPPGLTDPFDGQPLRYAVAPDGVTVYSIGSDGIDDGGEVVVRSGKPRDVGFRLWNADRRKVPKAEK